MRATKRFELRFAPGALVGARNHTFTHRIIEREAWCIIWVQPDCFRIERVKEGRKWSKKGWLKAMHGKRGTLRYHCVNVEPRIKSQRIESKF